MKLAGKFLLAVALWATGIAALMIIVSVITSDEFTAGDSVRSIARAITLAAFPAGIAIARDVFGDPLPWRQLFVAVVTATAVSIVVFLLVALVGPAVSDDIRSLAQLVEQTKTAGEDWETLNDSTWVFITTLLGALNTWLYAAIGLQVGTWTSYALPRALQRPLYWAVGLGVLITGFAVWDTTYETIVLHTHADARFAAFYTVLIPSSVCAGLALPTLALARRLVIPKNTG